ncbi:YdcF family protein [Puniceicoccaceae bacterium K14]|nr:YdcF family protein [Puniceicoccaceae bacterium K14]
MSFILTKTLSTLLYPVFTSLLLIVLGLIFRLFRKWPGYFLIIAGVAYLYVCSIQPTADWLASSLEKDYPQIGISDVPEADAIVLLGGGLNFSNNMLNLETSADRALYAARLFKAEKASMIMATGGATLNQRPESEAMTEFLVELGVPEKSITQENEALNTYQHTVYLSPLLEQESISSLILVTSAWHMRRSIDVFDSNFEGIEIIPYPVDSMVSQSQIVNDYIPTIEALTKTSKLIREYVGYFVYDIRGWIK